MLRKFEAIVMVPQRIEFETCAKDGVELTNAAHRAAAELHSVDGHQPRLAQTRIVEEIDPYDEAA